MSRGWMLRTLIISVGFTGIAAIGFADEPVSVDVQEAVRQAVGAGLPGVPIELMTPGPIPGLWTVETDDLVVYVDQQGRYLFAGGVYDLQSRRNLTVEHVALKRVRVRTQITHDPLTDRRITLGPDTGTPRLIVFIDPDCQFCRKIHPELKTLAARGWRIDLLLMPVPSLHPDAYRKSVTIWCGQNRLALLEQALDGRPVSGDSCAHPVDQVMALGRRLGVTGTPALLLPDGKMIEGYRSAEDLVKLVGPDAAGAGVSRPRSPQEQDEEANR